MPDEVIDTAHLFALHAQACPICSRPDHELCAEGLRLLKMFHDALNGMLNQRPFDA